MAPPPSSASAAVAAARLHREHFGRLPARLAVAPGRVNLIGEHVDHAGGPVLPVAIERRAAVAAGRGVPGQVRVRSRELGAATVAVAGHASDVADAPAWARAMAAIAARTGVDAASHGLDVTIASDVPVGGGLSSSAAVLVAAQLSIAPEAGTDPVATAAAARAIEHEVLGVPCGPMDQLAAALCRAGHALLLHCDTGTWRHVALPRDGLHLMLIDTGLRHQLADGRYAARLADLRRARRTLGITDWPAFAASPEVVPQLARLRASDPPAAARARHVAAEIARTHAAVAALEDGDPAAFGRALDAGHASMRDDFEASAPGVEAVRTSLRHAAGDALLGSRIVGAGWGGGILAATRHPLSGAVLAAILGRAVAATGCRARAIPVRGAGPARVIDPATVTG